MVDSASGRLRRMQLALAQQGATPNRSATVKVQVQLGSASEPKWVDWEFGPVPPTALSEARTMLAAQAGSTGADLDAWIVSMGAVAPRVSPEEVKVLLDGRPNLLRKLADEVRTLAGYGPEGIPVAGADRASGPRAHHGHAPSTPAPRAGRKAGRRPARKGRR